MDYSNKILFFEVMYDITLNIKYFQFTNSFIINFEELAEFLLYVM
jgi:hypothetical protein